MPKLLLKCRPTENQLTDRSRSPLPDGIELYLDIADISGKDWFGTLCRRIEATPKPKDFVYIVEGPLRSLDNSFFDVSQENPAHEEVIRRVLAVGREIGAKAVVVHAISAKDSFADWNGDLKQADLERAAAFLEKYALDCRESGIIPTIENIPPVARMREGKYLYSSIGVDPTDLIWLTQQVKGLKVTLDVSHAQLYINAATKFPEDATEDLSPLLHYYHGKPGITSIGGCIRALADKIANVHISNAGGLLDEGLPYGQGDMDLDAVVGELACLTPFIVTETLEPDPDNAALMREAQERITTVLRKLGKRN